MSVATATYRVRLYPYSGSYVDLLSDGDLETCRNRVARRIRDHRNRYEYPVSTLERGRNWELESDPDGMFMVSDGEGILAIEAVEDDVAECEGNDPN